MIVETNQAKEQQLRHRVIRLVKLNLILLALNVVAYGVAALLIRASSE